MTSPTHEQPLPELSPAERLSRDNAYLRQRNEQLQGDVTALSADLARLTQQLERLYGREPGPAPGSLSRGDKMTFMSRLRGLAPSEADVRAEIWSLGAQHRGEPLTGA